MGKSPNKLPETVSALPDQSPQDAKPEPNPFRDGDWRMLGYAWSGMILRVLLIFGGIFSVAQFLLAREEKRVERSLQLVELWERPEYQTAQRAVKTRLEAVARETGNPLGPGADPADLAFLQRQVGLSVMSERPDGVPLAEFQEQFDRVVYFLNRVSFCVEENLCSRHVADSYFRDYAESFWAYFAGYVDARREAGSSTFAEPIERYVKAD